MRGGAAGLWHGLGSTVSIQKVALTCATYALVRRNGMFCEPPRVCVAGFVTVEMCRTVAAVIVWPAMAAASTEFGFVTAAWVTWAGVGVARNLLGELRLYSGKLFAMPGGGSVPPTGNGTALAWPGTGGPVSSDELPAADRAELQLLVGRVEVEEDVIVALEVRPRDQVESVT